MTLAKYMLPLKDELENDPLSRGYSTKTDKEVANSLTAKNIEKYRRVPLSEVQDWSSAKRLYKRFVDNGLEDGSLHNELKILLQGKQEDINFQSASTGVSGLIFDLVTNGILTETEAQELQSKGVYYISRAEELGYSDITAQTINNVRA